MPLVLSFLPSGSQAANSLYLSAFYRLQAPYLVPICNVGMEILKLFRSEALLSAFLQARGIYFLHSSINS